MGKGRMQRSTGAEHGSLYEGAGVCVCVCVHFDRRCCMLFGLFLQSRGCMCSVR